MSNKATVRRAQNEWNASGAFGVEKMGNGRWAVVNKSTDEFVSTHATKRAAQEAAR